MLGDLTSPSRRIYLDGLGSRRFDRFGRRRFDGLRRRCFDRFRCDCLHWLRCCRFWRWLSHLLRHLLFRAAERWVWRQSNLVRSDRMPGLKFKWMGVLRHESRFNYFGTASTYNKSQLLWTYYSVVSSGALLSRHKYFTIGSRYEYTL